MSRTRVRGAVLAALVAVSALTSVGGAARAAGPVVARSVVHGAMLLRTVTVGAPTATPVRPELGQEVAVSGSMPGHLRRPVAVYVDGRLRRRTLTGRRGHYRVVLVAPRRPTTLRVEARAPRFHGRRAARSSVRLVPVVIPVQRCAAMPAGTTVWASGLPREVDCLLTVPAGSTLTIGAGSTVLFGPGAGLVVKGSLDVRGRSDAPVRLRAATSTRWAGIRGTGDPSIDLRDTMVFGAQRGVDIEAVPTTPTGHLTVDHSTFTRCGSGVISQATDPTTYQMKASVTDSEFRDGTDGVWIEGATDPVVRSNSFHGLSGVPLTVTWSGVDPDLVAGDTGYGNVTNQWTLADSLVDADGTLTGGRADQAAATASAPRPLMPVVQAGFMAAPGVTLTIGSGVVKVASSLEAGHGRIDIEGTHDSPAILTSVTDDSVGDDLPGQAAPRAGDWAGIVSFGPADVTVRDAEVRYAQHGIVALAGGDISVFRSTFAHDEVGVLTAFGAVSIVQSTFLDDGSGVRVDTVSHPVVLDNSFQAMSDVPITIVDSTLDLGALAGNTAVDSSSRTLHLGGGNAVDVDSSWPMGPAVWRPGPPTTGEAVPLTAEVGSQVLIGPGTTVTFGSGAVKFDAGASLLVRGSVATTGTDSAPTVLTSVADSDIGGPVRPDVAGVGAWAGLEWQSDTSSTLSNTVLRDASIALTLAPGSSLSLQHVELANDDAAIVAPASGSCTNPFGTTSVTGSDVWFGATGGPGGLVALMGVTDPGSGDAQYDEAKAAYDAAVDRYGGFDKGVTDNTIPFSTWSCSSASFSFPVTPVQVDVAPAAPFPDYAQTGS